MKWLILKLVLPLTIISFFLFSKWWYALPVDAPDTMFTGFPLPYTCDGWATSLSAQIFVFELIIDFTIYLSLWLLAIFIINKFLIQIKTTKILMTITWIFCGLIIILNVLVYSNPDNEFYWKRPFKIEVLKTGIELPFYTVERPDLNRYLPKDKSKPPKFKYGF